MDYRAAPWSRLHRRGDELCNSIWTISKRKEKTHNAREKPAHKLDTVPNDRPPDPEAPASPCYRRPICTFFFPSAQLLLKFKSIPEHPHPRYRTPSNEDFPSIRIRAVGVLQMPRILKSTLAVKLPESQSCPRQPIRRNLPISNRTARSVLQMIDTYVRVYLRR